MKKIGLVGGTGPESTLMYYKELNARIDNLTGGRAMPDIAIESVNFRKTWDYVSSGSYEKLSDYLSGKVNSLKLAGAEVIALTAGTMHIVFDNIEKRPMFNWSASPRLYVKKRCAENTKKLDCLEQFSLWNRII